MPETVKVLVEPVVRPITDAEAKNALRALGNNNLLRQGISANAFIQPLGKITGKANEFQKSLEASNARVVAFGASAGAIFAVRAAFEKLISSTIEVERSLKEINVLLGVGSRDLQQFSNNLFKVANQSGTAFADAAKVAQEFSRQGLGVEETLKRTAAALNLSRLSGLGFEDSVSSLTATLNSFTKEALTAEDVVNRLAAVDAKFAVSSADLAEALKRVGASAADANVQFNETVALVTAAQQVTARGGSVIGNSFKTIFTRLQRPQVLEDLEAAGVHVKDLAGKALPLIEVLRNLSSTYDTLATSQRSFVAETVGGVYQINILKAILSDLGSGYSIFSRATDTASNSTGIAQQRLKELNETISSQLLRSMNELTRASSNLGNSTFANALRGGIGSFDTIFKSLADASDPLQKETSKFASTFQATLKGLGNLLSGPAIQSVVFIIGKLLGRLGSFTVESIKDIGGFNKVVKDQQNIEKDITEFLRLRPKLLEDALNKQVSVNQIASQYLKTLEAQNRVIKDTLNVVKSTAVIVRPNIPSFPTGNAAAQGHIPSLSTERHTALRGGYVAGKIMNVGIRNGSDAKDIIANGAETRATFWKNGMPYDFINPKPGSQAAVNHRNKSISKTGIDPYSLQQTGLAAGGFIPSLAISADELVERAQMLFAKPEDKPKLDALTKSFRKKGSISDDQKLFYQAVKGVLMGNQRVFGQLSPDQMQDISGLLLRQNIKGARLEKKAAAETSLNPDDVQALLSHYAEEFPMIAAYNSAQSMQTPKNMTQGQVLSAGGRDFRIPVRVLGHKGGIPLLQDTIKALSSVGGQHTGVKGPVQLSASKFGAGFGQFFETHVKQFFAERGVRVDNSNETLDIQGFSPDVLEYLSTKSKFAGADVKASVEEAGNMSAKIFRTLAGEPGDPKTMNRYSLKGPTGYVPPLVNIPDFDKTAGNIGILDPDAFKQAGGSPSEFMSLIYAAVASRKPMKINYGPMGSGKTTSAKLMAQTFGGNFINARGDLAAYKRFILTKTDKENPEEALNKGVFGLALSAASNIEGFMKSPEQLRANIKSRGRAGEENADMFINDNTLGKYEQAFKILQAKFGPLGRFKVNRAAEGMIPNLSMHDDIKRITSLANQMKMMDYVALQSRQYTQNMPQNIAGKFRSGFDKEFLVAALANSVMGKDVSSDLAILQKANGITPSLFEVLLQDFSSKLNVPELKKRVELGEFAQGFIPNMAIRDWFRRSEPITRSHNVINKGRAVVRDEKGRFLPNSMFTQSGPYAEPRNLPFRLPNGKMASGVLNASNEFNTSVPESWLEQAAKGHVPNLAKKKFTHADLDAAHGGYKQLYTEFGAMYGSLTNGRYDGVKKKQVSPEAYQAYQQLYRKTGRAFKKFDKIRNALERENVATGGNAILSASPSLVSNDNPAGLAAIDKRSQRNADEAIMQHRMLGDSMSEIRRAGAAAGHVPNLAVNDFASQGVMNSILFGILQFGEQTDAAASSMDFLRRKISPLFPVIDVEIAKKREQIKSYNDSIVALDDGEKQTVKINNQVFKSSTDLRSALEKDIVKMNQDVERYDRQRADSRRNTRGFGLKASALSAFAGGVASEVASGFNPTAGRAIDNFTAGITTAGQVLTAFPNKIGKSLGVGFLAQGVLSSIDTFMKGTENSAKALEIQQSRVQKLVAQLDSLSNSIVSLDGMFNDSAVTTTTLIKENRKYAETLSQLNLTPGGKETAERLQSAGTSQAKLQIINEAKLKQTSDLDRAATLQALKEQFNNRKFLGLFNSGPFSFSNIYEKDNVQASLTDAGAKAVSTLSTDFKQALIGVVDNLDDFEKVLATFNKSGDESVGKVREYLQAIQETGGTEARTKVVQQTRAQLNEEKILADPQYRSLRQRSIENDSARQQRLDAALRQQQNLRRLFLNQGSLRGGGLLDLQGSSNRANAGRNSEAYSFGQGILSLFQQQFGERSVRAVGRDLELNRVDNERDTKLGAVDIQASRALIENLAQTFDSVISTTQFNPAPQEVAPKSIGLDTARFVELLNKGLSEGVQKQGGFANFFKGGDFNPEELAGQIAKASGGNKQEQDKVFKYIASNANSVEFLKIINGTLNEISLINQDSLNESKKIKISFDTFIREADFKRFASFLGGIRNLTDRGLRRQQERDLKTGFSLLSTARTQEARGLGATKLLDFFKNNQIPIDLKDKNIAGIFSVAAKSLGDTQRKSVERLVNSPSFNKLSSANQALFKSVLKVDFTKTSLAALQKEYLPENDKLTSETSKMFEQYTASLGSGVKKLEEQVNNSDRALLNFVRSVDFTSERLLKSEGSVENLRKIITREKETDPFKAAADRRANELRTSGPQAPGIDQRKNVAGFFSQYGTTIISGALAGIGFAFSNKLLGAIRLPFGRGASSAAATTAAAAPRSLDIINSGRAIVRGENGRMLPNRTFTQSGPFGYTPVAPVRLPNGRMASANPNATNAFNTSMPESWQNRPQTGGVVAGGVAARAAGLSRNARIGLGVGLPVAANMLAGQIDNPYLSSAVGIGGIAAGLAVQTPKGAALAARALPFLANPYVLGTAAVGGGLAAGGFINQKFSAGGFGAKEGNTLVASATQSRNFATAKLVEAKFRRGDSLESIQKVVEEKLEQTLKDRQRVTGVLSSISGEGPQRDALDRAAEELRQLSARLPELINQRDDAKKLVALEEQQQAEQKDFNERLLKALTANVGEGGTGKMPVNLKLFVSFEGDKMSSRLYSDNTSVTDTTTLKSRLDRVERALNLTPEPAKI